jgi:geranylgeranyl diphosphate synthase type II
MSASPDPNSGLNAPAANTRDPLSPPPEFDAYLAEFLRSRGLSANLHDATAYSLLGSGKRFRPVLCALACRACGGDEAAALAPAAAVELVHCFSLVHDDLPALDNDDLRRGRPTLHKHAGEAMAILSGDLMLTLAFELLAERTRSGAEHCVELARATRAMIQGQVHDTLGGLDSSLAPLMQVQAIHANKTGALIAAACRMGVIAAAESGVRVPSTALNAITSYAEHLGLVFQITDDLLDVTQTAEHTGKNTGKDAAAGKLTYPGIMGIEQAREQARHHTAAAVESLAVFGDRGTELAAVGRRVLERTK